MNINALIEAITTIEDYVINARVQDIKFTIIDDGGGFNSLPVIDVSVTNKAGIQIFGDLNMETFEEAIIETARGLTQ